ncbi:HalOD1 output domain-containing protein [Halobellus litoreus]|uniref:HalOD1 output domain-containing protein n=1 Tax=Halobellus litoreus TaxID=755310 RepID=A0ABD6DSQ2_9EURY|nr:HalOD1 output domain-containing protein [Halobellus litoreus]
MMETTVSEQIVEHVASATDTDPLELPPLYESIDPDALNALVAGPGDVEITFPYAGREVCVESGGAISIVDCSESPTADGIAADD